MPPLKARAEPCAKALQLLGKKYNYKRAKWQVKANQSIDARTQEDYLNDAIIYTCQLPEAQEASEDELIEMCKYKYLEYVLFVDSREAVRQASLREYAYRNYGDIKRERTDHEIDFFEQDN